MSTPVVTSNIALEALRTAAHQRRLVFFVGAGVSTLPPTSLPLADPIKASLILRLVERCAEKGEYSWTDAFTDVRLYDLPFELILDTIYNVVGTKALRVFDLCSGSAPNVAHCALIDMLGRHVPAIISTNQDRALESAADLIGTSVNVAVASRDFARPPSGPTIFKLHGSVDSPKSIVATLAQAMIGLSKAKQSMLRKVLAGRFVCFVGWSGRDLDIAPVLSRVLTNGMWVLRPLDGDQSVHAAPDARAFALCAQLGIKAVRWDLLDLFATLSSELALPTAQQPGLIRDSATSSSIDVDAFLADWARGVSVDDAAEALSVLSSYFGDIELLIQSAEAAFAVAKKQNARRVAAAQHRLAVAYQRAGEYGKARWHAGRSLQAARKRGDVRQQARSLGTLAAINYREGRNERAAKQLRMACKLAISLQDRANWAHFRDRLGSIHARRSDWARALTYYQEAAQAAQQSGVAHRFAGTQTNIGNCQVELGDVEQGMETLKDAATFARSIGDDLHLAVALFNLGSYHNSQRRDAATALALLEDALRIFEGAGERSWTAYTQAEIGAILIRQSDSRSAVPFLESSLTYLRTTPRRRLFGQVQEMLNQAREHE